MGHLTACNYEIDRNVDALRLLNAVSSFLGARIVRRRLVEKLERTSMHDNLTGLLNRRGIDTAIESRLASHPDEPFALALLDIDDFKILNDLHGHSVGDQALITLADAMRSTFPPDAVLGRNGGDELLIMLFGDAAQNAGDRFAAFAEGDFEFEHDGSCHWFTISIGYSTCPGEASNLAEAYSKTDAALYAVKLGGKRGAKRYSPDMASQYRSQLGFTPRDIAENVPGAILVHRAGGDGEILFANDELVDMFECDGLSDFMHFTKGTYKEMVHPDDQLRVYEEATAQVSLDQVGARNFFDFRIVAKSGAVKNVAQNGRLVEIDGIGKVFYVIIIDRDEHDRKSRNK